MSNPCTLKPNETRARMTALNVTQAALAAACGIDVRTLQRWFAGQRVSLHHAESLAAALGVGTAEIFSGVPEETGTPISTRFRLIQRLLSARDSAFAQGVRLVHERFEFIAECVTLSAHPAHGFVTRQPVGADDWNHFVAFELSCPGPAAEFTLRCQLGRRFGYITARLRLHGGKAYLVETFQTHSMVANRAQDGSLLLWFWVPREHREIVFAADEAFSIRASDSRPRAQTLNLDELADHEICVRPNTADLRAADLPMGFDRLIGSRDGRVDLPVDWDALGERIPESQK